MSEYLSAVYGPIASRRLGRSLGINLLGPQKICSYDCPYCDLGPSEIRMNRLKKDISFISPEALKLELSTALEKEHASPEQLNSICISGNGEPLLYPDFAEVVDIILQTRDALYPGVKVAILSNGAHLEGRKTVLALNKLDERMIKVDAGNERTFKVICNPLIRQSLQQFMTHIRGLDNFIAQSFFVHGAVDNTQISDIEDWIEVISLLKPKAVHLLTPCRTIPKPDILPVSEELLYEIAARLLKKTQIPSLVFP